MWGTLDNGVTLCSECRFIPTHVGNTARSRSRRSVWPVHPHACGEHRRSRDLIAPIVGSSPRMWGTPEITPQMWGCPRFIPTHVGNTLSNYLIPFLISVHPHACGEHLLCDPSNSIIDGSSPRMWGTQQRSHDLPCNIRFIPTHVGNTQVFHLLNIHVTVHPHACGEH